VQGKEKFGYLRFLGAALASTLALSGCGALQPGTAVTLGEETISQNKVDEWAEVYCDSIEEQLGENAIPMRVLRTLMLITLANNEIARQVGSEYDVEAGSVYAEALATAEKSATLIVGDDAEILAQIQTSNQYLGAIADKVGEKILTEEGISEVTVEAAAARGEAALQAWSATNEAIFDPRFGVAMSDRGLPSPDELVDEITGVAEANPDAEVSYAASGAVTFTDVVNAINTASGQAPAAGTDPQEAAALVKSFKELPDTQRCGPA
jgi:hypothetical protein